jgi:cytoskeletal protein CcmA (bactofilin family)
MLKSWWPRTVLPKCIVFAVDFLARGVYSRGEVQGLLMLWKPKSRFFARRGDLAAFIDEGSEIEGKYTFSGTVVLNGKFQGEIVSPDTLIIGKKGVINATIRVGSALISGEVVGNVLATERVELRRNARVFGDLEAPVVVVEEGVLFEGHCRMTKSKPVEAMPTRDLSVVRLPR